MINTHLEFCCDYLFANAVRPPITSTTELWRQIKDPDNRFSIEYALDVLNERQKHRKSFPHQMKEYICWHRPDLIGKIEHLPRRLRRKYKAELELSRMDL